MQVTQTQTASQTQTSNSASGKPLTETQSTDFMMMLLAQLRNQNPMEPLDDQALMAQFTQLNSLTELQKINNTLGELGEMMNGSDPSELLVNAAQLVGKSVDIQQSNGQVLSGVASRISSEMGQILVWMKNTAFPLEDVIGVSEASEVVEDDATETPVSEVANGE